MKGREATEGEKKKDCKYFIFSSQGKKKENVCISVLMTDPEGVKGVDVGSRHRQILLIIPLL